MISVLYVDDEPALLEIAKLFLETSNEFIVDTKTSAQEGLDLLKHHSFEAIISDYQMPGMDGIVFLKAVRERFGDIPFILFTGRGREEVVIDAINNGADFYLQKGGDPEAQFVELAHKIRQAVRRKQAEISLKESERRYRDVVEHQTEFISRFKPDGTHVFANEAYCRYFKKRVDEIIGHRFVPSIPEEDQDLVRRHFAAFTLDHPVADIEHRVIMPDGSIRWHWWNDHAIFDDAGRIIEYLSIGKDITDRKLAEEELKRSENLYRTIFTATGAATIITAPDTTILLANETWEKMTGVPRSEQENKLSWTVFFDREDVERMTQYHHARRKDPSLAPTVYESRLIDAKKAVHYCVVHVHMIPGTKNSVASLVDITELKQAEEALQQVSTELQQIFKNMTNAFIVWESVFDENSNYISFRFGQFNDAYARIAKVKYEDVRGKDIFEVWPATEQSWVEVYGCVATTGIPRVFDMYHEPTHGWYHCNAYRPTDSPAQIYVIFEDITERRQAEADLHAAYEQITATEEELRSQFEELSINEQRIRESEEQYRLVVENSYNAVYIYRDNQILFANRRATDLSGYTHDELMEKNIWDLVHRDDRARMQESRDRRISGSALSPNITGRIIRKSGEVLDCEFFISRILYQNQPALLGIIRDITEQKKAEEGLRQSQQMLAEAMDLAHLASWDYDFRTGEFTFDDRFYALYGTTADREGGNRMPAEVYTREFIHPEDRCVLAEEVDKARKTSDPHYVSQREHRIIRRDGEIRHIVVRIEVTKDAEGRTIKTHGVNQDITEQKRSEKALQESEATAHAIINAPTDSVILMDTKGIVLALNETAAALLGKRRDEVCGLLADGLLPKEVAESRRLLIPQIIDEKKIVRFENERAGRWYDTVMYPIVSDTGVVTRIAIIGRDITERKRAEDLARESEERFHDIAEALRQSEAKFRSFVENANDIIYLMDLTGRIIDISPQISRYGYTPEEIISKNLAELIVEEDLPVVLKDFETTISTGQSTRTVFRIRDKSGNILWMEDNGPAVFDESGNVIGLAGILRDITDRKRVDEALHESEEKFRSIVETSPDMVWEMDSMGKFRYISPRIKTIMGLSPEELVGKPITDLIPEQQRSLVMQKLTRYISSEGEISSLEVPVRHRDGHHLVIEIRPSKMIGRDGKFKGLLGVAHDITERKRAEAILRESEEKFRSIVETSPNMIWEVDLSGKFRYMSPMVQTILGYKPEEIIGRSITDLVPEEMKSSAVKELDKLSKSSKPSSLEFPARHRNGTEMVLEIRPARTMSPDGKHIGFHGVAVDMTDRKRAEEALHHVNSQLTLLTGITRHDILNNISVILGFLKITEKKFKDPALADLLGKMESATKAIRTQIEFTRVYQNLGTHAPQWINLDAVMPRSQIPPAISLRSDIQGVVIFADPMLEKVFFNLLDNSIRHGERVTDIRVSSHKSGEDMIVVWEDNGIGIVADEKERIFERGFGKNTGLGMFLVREILSLTGITIKETGVPGTGARFEITVPAGKYRTVDQN